MLLNSLSNFKGLAAASWSDREDFSVDNQNGDSFERVSKKPSFYYYFEMGKKVGGTLGALVGISTGGLVSRYIYKASFGSAIAWSFFIGAAFFMIGIGIGSDIGIAYDRKIGLGHR